MNYLQLFINAIDALLELEGVEFEKAQKDLLGFVKYLKAPENVLLNHVDTKGKLIAVFFKSVFEGRLLEIPEGICKKHLINTKIEACLIAEQKNIIFKTLFFEQYVEMVDAINEIDSLL